MCSFKSGLILKNRCYVGDLDSHSDMLEKLKIEDTTENAMTKFVRAELIPLNNEWWTSPADWKFVVDQDVLPDWFSEDKEKYEQEFRTAVTLWMDEHVLVDKKIDELSSGYYRLKRCEVKKLINDVSVMLDNSTVSEMRNNSTVSRMWNNSTVSEMWDNSTVSRMLDNSTVSRMWGNSTVSEMLGNSTVSRMLDNSTVSRMWGNSTVSEMWDNSTVSEMLGNSTVSEMLGNSIARNIAKGKILVSSTTRLEIEGFANKEV